MFHGTVSLGIGIPRILTLASYSMELIKFHETPWNLLWLTKVRLKSPKVFLSFVESHWVPFNCKILMYFMIVQQFYSTLNSQYHIVYLPISMFTLICITWVGVLVVPRIGLVPHKCHPTNRYWLSHLVTSAQWLYQCNFPPKIPKYYRLHIERQFIER